jgi:hypothetical protein
MSDPSTETEIAVIKEKQSTMEAHLKANDAAIAALVEERNKALKWGIMSLGSAVLGMGYWIFNFLTGGHWK